MSSKKSKNSANKQKDSTNLNNKEVNDKKMAEDIKISMVEAKKALKKMQDILRTTAISLPSLVLLKDSNSNNMNGVMEDRFEVNSELIEMLEIFFGKLVFMLKLRSSFDKKLHQIYKYIKHLETIESQTEFKGNLQLLGISLMEIEQIIKEYQEIYTNLFTEQALLQFQLMEQLMLFRDKDLPNFLNIFEDSIETFRTITRKLSTYTEN